jgi:hypothetical protein
MAHLPLIQEHDMIIRWSLLTLVAVVLAAFTVVQAHNSAESHDEILVAFGSLDSLNAENPAAKSRQAYESGCWVTVYSKRYSKGSSLTINGPSQQNNMRDLPGSGGRDWGDDIRSFRVGPNAKVVFYEDEGYSDSSITFGPNTYVEDMDNHPSIGNDNIDSYALYYVR